MIKVLTDQSASDSEPAIILTESNEHSKPRSAPNMKGDVPETEEPGRLQSIGLQRVKHD